ncbi:hypothetical protein [uncultured Polaribacter sp.]|uniref:hypothetical protein n=1 Tax=uncultured Polaribacter sp. TaxID=174711 RepID=UPI002620087E|nr:hypothetical protein [uncultured Polaribacter sp.]
MKTIKLITLFAIFAFVFSSCSNNETLSLENETAIQPLLKTYKIKRDATGAYSVDFNVAENVRVEKVKNYETNTSQIHLYESDEISAQKQSEELVIDGKKLAIGFIDTNINSASNITIEDDNISLAKTNSTLKDYSIETNEDGTFTLGFNVNSQTDVDFVFNEESNIYEIHLEKGKSDVTSFSRTLTKTGDVLKIDFVNHTNVAAKGLASKALIKKRRKPRIVVGNGESVENL